MSIGTNIYNAVQNNRSTEFDALLDGYFPDRTSLFYVIQNVFEYNPLRHCITFPKTTEELKTARSHAKNHEKQTIQRFCVMFEKWLGRQNSKTRAQALTCDHYNFHIEFLQNARDPVSIINGCDARCYLTMNDHRYDKDCGNTSIVIDCEPLTQMLNAKLGACVDAIVSQKGVQQMLSQKILDLDPFFACLLKPQHISHALHYLECMQHHFTPRWVGQFLNALFATKNYQVGQWLKTNTSFAQFLQASNFSAVGVQITYWTARAYKDLLPYELFFPSTLWNSVVKETTLACVGGKHFSTWVEHIQRPQFDGQRVKMVQQHLERHFAQKQDDYKYGQCTIDNKTFNKIVTPVLNILTTDDVVDWKNTPWFLDQLYRVDEHNCFVRHRLEQAIGTNGCEAVRKI